MANTMSYLYGAIDGQGGYNLPGPCDNAVSAIEQGDLVYFDTADNLVKKAASDANCATLLGVAKQPSIVSSGVDNTGAPKEKQVQVSAAAVHGMLTTAAETYNTGDLVYFGANSKTITKVAATNAVGRVILPPGQTALVGAAGVSVPVLIFTRAYVRFAE
jgi:hypothetical protein